MSEAIYDTEIAPLLMRAAELCKTHGLSMACMVEYQQGDTGLTLTGPIDVYNTCASMFLADRAVRARGNFDALAFAVMKHARAHGHSSAILYQLGIPLAPSDLAAPESPLTQQAPSSAQGSGGEKA